MQLEGEFCEQNNSGGTVCVMALTQHAVCKNVAPQRRRIRPSLSNGQCHGTITYELLLHQRFNTKR